jgi:hypothetical protein
MMFGSEVQFGDDKDAVGFLEYVKQHSPDTQWEIIKI